MAKVRHEIYDDEGLVKVEYVEMEEISTEDIIAQKEKELLEMYTELEKLKNNKLY